MSRPANPSMMNRMKTLAVGIALVAGALAPLADANAWVAAAGGWRGGAVPVGGYRPYPYYRPPGGCYGCGAAVGAVAGLAVGAAVASAAAPVYVAPPVYAAPPVYVAPPPVVVSQPAYVVPAGMPLGTQLASVPAGASRMVVNGVTYYQYGPTWYKPYYGSSGVYYEVVPTP